MSSFFRAGTGRAAWLRVLGPTLLAGALAAGCAGTSGASSPPTPTASRPAFSGAGARQGIVQCLRKHGVALPTARPGAFPTARPSPGAQGPPAGGFPGGLSGSFRKALKACGAALPNGIPG